MQHVLCLAEVRICFNADTVPMVSFCTTAGTSCQKRTMQEEAQQRESHDRQGRKLYSLQTVSISISQTAADMNVEKGDAAPSDECRANEMSSWKEKKGHL